MNPTLLLASPCSGAVSGVEEVTRLTLAALRHSAWDVAHVDTATAHTNGSRGFLTLGGILRLLDAMHRVRSAALSHKVSAVWIPIAANRAALLKFLLLSLAPKAHGCRIIAKFGGGDFDRWLTHLAPASRAMASRILRRADVVLVEAKRLQKQFYDVLPPEQVRWAHLGIDHENWKVPVRTGPIRNLLFVGHISRAKGAFDLLTAFQTVRQKVPDVRLRVLGEPIRRERNIVWIPDTDGRGGVALDQPGVEASGIVTGAAKHRAFEEADLFILPSHSEGFPVSVLEAMASGLPIVCTPVGALPEILPPWQWERARFVSVGDADYLAYELCDLIRAVRRSRLMGIQGRKYVELAFTLQHYARGLERAVGDIL